MSPLGFALFETALGPCAGAWSARGFVGLQLSEGNGEATRSRISARFPLAEETAPPAWARAAFDQIAAMLRGETADLSEAPLDMEGIGAFEAKVFETVRAIPLGETRSYGEIASAVGAPGGAQAVGRAMARNPFAPIVPCHRVIGADGRMIGFSAHGGVDTKRRLLAIEGRSEAQGSFFDAWDETDA